MVGRIAIDLNRLSYGEYCQFLAGERSEIDLLCRVVTDWPFSADPSEPASYAALGLLDLLAVQRALRAAIQEAAGN